MHRRGYNIICYLHELKIIIQIRSKVATHGVDGSLYIITLFLIYTNKIVNPRDF